MGSEGWWDGGMDGRMGLFGVKITVRWYGVICGVLGGTLLTILGLGICYCVLFTY